MPNGAPHETASPSSGLRPPIPGAAAAAPIALMTPIRKNCLSTKQSARAGSEILLVLSESSESPPISMGRRARGLIAACTPGGPGQRNATAGDNPCAVSATSNTDAKSAIEAARTRTAAAGIATESLASRHLCYEWKRAA
eukprot:scaffold19178_cov129-Isochrysis_galbana.AAC.4